MPPRRAVTTVPESTAATRSTPVPTRAFSGRSTGTAFEAAGVSLPLPPGTELPSGEYKLGIRPEYVSLANADAPGALPMEVRQVQDVGTHVILSATREGALVKARLAPDSMQPQMGDTAWLQVMGAHTCFYKNEEIVA
jgi:glycerol transport system ATP-binding protein